MIGKIIYQLFTTDETMSDVLEGRVYPVTIPQGEQAHNSAVYQRRLLLTEECDGGAEIRTEHATVWLMSHQYATVQTLCERVNTIIKDLKGDIQGVTVMSAKRTEEQDGFDVELRLYFIEIELEILTIKN